MMPPSAFSRDVSQPLKALVAELQGARGKKKRSPCVPRHMCSQIGARRYPLPADIKRADVEDARDLREHTYRCERARIWRVAGRVSPGGRAHRALAILKPAAKKMARNDNRPSSAAEKFLRKNGPGRGKRMGIEILSKAWHRRSDRPDPDLRIISGADADRMQPERSPRSRDRHR